MRAMAITGVCTRREPCQAPAVPGLETARTRPIVTERLDGPKRCIRTRRSASVSSGSLTRLRMNGDHLIHDDTAGEAAQDSPIPAAWQLWVAFTGHQARLRPQATATGQTAWSTYTRYPGANQVELEPCPPSASRATRLTDSRKTGAIRSPSDPAQVGSTKGQLTY